MVCIKHLGCCLCPRCLMNKKYVSELGTLNDQRRRNHIRIDSEHMRSLVERARKLIFQKGRLVNGTAIQNILGSQSLTPTRVSLDGHLFSGRFEVNFIQNAFSQALLPLGVNYFDMFVVDFLHEVELGVWRGFFRHTLRILHAVGASAVVQLDKR
jgi:hypothetical protein